MSGTRSRRSSFGSIRRLPSGRYQARYTGPDGIKHPAPVTFDTKGDAETWLSTVRADIVRGLWTSTKGVQTVDPLLGEYAEDWLFVRSLRPRTRQHYRSLLDSRILPTLANVPLKDVTPGAIRGWFAAIDDGKATSRAHAYGLLRTILAQAVIDGLIPANPCHIRGAGAAKRVVQIEPASLPELTALVAAMPEKYRAAVLLAAWCGLRFGELTELRRKDVDLKGHVVKIRRAVAWVDSKPIVGKPKSDAGSRDVAIPPHLVPAIEEHLRNHAQPGRDGLLFPSPTGTHLTTSTLYASFWPARKKAGRPDLRWHDLRHTGATLAAQTGATLSELMGRIGHSTPAAAMRYQHAAKGRDAEIARALSKLAAGDA